MSDEIPLDPATYWRLRYLAADAELADARARVAMIEARQRLDRALAAAGVPDRGEWRWDDATYTLHRRP